MVRRCSIASEILERHAQLENLHGDGDGGNFLSGWQCDNPWRAELDSRVDKIRAGIDRSRYAYLEGSDDVRTSLMKLHSEIDATPPETIFCAAGSSSLIFTFCAWLKDQGITEVRYIPPLYFSMISALKLLGIEYHPVSRKQPYEPGFSIELPRSSSVLLMTDPVWYAGISFARDTVDMIREWQLRTGSLVFVDGSFGYMRWDGRRFEEFSRLDASKTVRIVCPTKALGLHGYRFAYGLVPTSMYQTFSRMHGYIYASTSYDSVAFAQAVIPELIGRRLIDALMNVAAKRHRNLRVDGKTTAPWSPNCGYFIFEELLNSLPDGTLTMDGKYFGQKRYARYRRINLLSPSFQLLY